VFVRRFFSEHIEELYVRDFRQLRTENHPLMLRYEIMELVHEIATTEPARSQLLAGYADLPSAKLGTVEDLLERDVQRFERLHDVETFLERMDRVIDSATQRALAYLSYRLKASERLEDILLHTVAIVNELEQIGEPISGRLLSPDPLIADCRLRMPSMPAAKPVRRSIKKREMTLRERAEFMLRRAMVQARDTTPRVVQRYVERHVPLGDRFDDDELPVRDVGDAVAQLVLVRLAAIRRADPNAMRSNPLLRDLDFDVMLIEGDRTDGEYFEMPKFTISRRKKNAS
jgi:hypothetical protein